MDTTKALTINGNGTAIETIDRPSVKTMAMVIGTGDHKNLTDEQRLAYIAAVCKDLGLNPLTRPFEFITVQNRVLFYARREAADQLAAARNITLSLLPGKSEDGLYTVTAIAVAPNGRRNTDVGIVATDGLRGEALANARMKAHSKARRRVILGICGLGWMVDSSEQADRFDDEPASHVITDPGTGYRVDAEQGKIIDESETTEIADDGSSARRVEAPSLRDLFDDADSSQAAVSATPLTCQLCDNLIEGHQFPARGNVPGVKWSTLQVAENTTQKFGKRLCWDCRMKQPAAPVAGGAR